MKRGIGDEEERVLFLCPSEGGNGDRDDMFRLIVSNFFSRRSRMEGGIFTAPPPPPPHFVRRSRNRPREPLAEDHKMIRHHLPGWADRGRRTEADVRRVI